jgi:hypothetical protein
MWLPKSLAGLTVKPTQGRQQLRLFEITDHEVNRGL